MKRERKSEIMQAARMMFGEKGYNCVSLRDIAEALHISVGNLTYHFPKKEDLIEAVITEQFTGYRPPQAVGDLPALHEYFCRHFQFQREKRFYFRHYTQLAEICPRIYEIQCQVRRDQLQFFDRSLAALEAAGRLEPALFPGQRAGLLRAITLVSIHGEAYFEREGQGDCVRAGVESLWSIVAPCLTALGRQELAALMTDWASAT